MEEHLCSLLRRAGEPLRVVVEYALHGGKRLRGLLLMAAGDGFPVDRGRLAAAAAAVELLHAATLVQDDIFDGSRVRRGRAAAHCAFDPRLATLASDWMLTEALRAAYRLHPEFGESVGLCAERMMDGEARELAPASAPSTLPAARAAAAAIARAKTGELFGVAASAPAWLLGEKSTAAPLHERGVELGLAFQYADDALDLYGDEEAAGKTLARDLPAGLRTLPVLDACGLLPPELGGALLRGHWQILAAGAPREAVLGFAAAHWEAAVSALLGALPEPAPVRALLEGYAPRIAAPAFPPAEAARSAA